VSRWERWARSEADAIRAAGRWREVRDFDAAGPEGKLGDDGRPVVSFASNDYLGLSQHPEVIAAAERALDRWGAGAGAARLTVGSRPVHTELERALADWKHTDRAVLFPTGFAANLGALGAVGGPGTLIVSDELNHASIVDGCRLSRSDVVVARHNDPEHVDALIREHHPDRTIVVTEAVFSMDGDRAPLEHLMARCATHGALLVVDEAHAVLDEGTDLGAVAASSDVEILRVGTLSKTLGSLGGFVAGSAPLCDLVVNRARSYIFTTAPPPSTAAAALAALGVLRSPDGAARRARLAAHVHRVRPGHPSPIIPVILGSEDRTLAAAAALLEDGMLVPAIRPPTVPAGRSRLRVTLSAAHSDEQVDALVAALDRLA
jgi:8-amino-7-oxononanoate synthase